MIRKILVIDDDKAVRNSFILSFEDTGFKVDTAESGMVGIEKMKTESFDLVFLDLRMPVMDGIETLRQIKKFNYKTLVYIFTAFHPQFFNDLEKAITEGLQFEIIQKPLDSDQLKYLVESIFGIQNE